MQKKTSVALNQQKVKLAKQLTHQPVLKNLLDEALDALISKARRQSLLEVLGTNFFEGDLKKMRSDRGGSR